MMGTDEDTAFKSARIMSNGARTSPLKENPKIASMIALSGGDAVCKRVGA